MSTTPERETRFTLAEAAQALSLREITVLYYIQYSHTLPERRDEQGNLYLLASDLHAYREQHQSVRRGRPRTKTPRPL